MNVVTNFPLPHVNKEKLTRYFTFSRVNPRLQDYHWLIETCLNIDAFLVYKTYRDINRFAQVRTRLVGFMVLRGRKTVVSDLGRLFPNFFLTGFHKDTEDIFDVIRSWHDNEALWISDADDTTFFVNEHPFEGVRRKLFP